MIISIKAISLTTALYLFLFVSSSSAQLSYQLNPEFGIYNSSSSFLQKESGLLIRIEGKLSYLYETENSSASLNVKARPELFGINKLLTSFKFKVGGEYERHEETFDWGLNLTRQLNEITNNNVHINYDIFSLQGHATFSPFEDFPITSIIGYAYQDVSSGSQQNLDLLFLDAKANHIFSPYSGLGYGLYFEKFSIETKQDNNYQNKIGRNSGYRIGPEIEFNLVKEFLINLQYSFLFHESDVTSFPSYEQCIKLVAGKILFQDVSAFILINFYLREYKDASSSADKLSILYTPINQENFINLKTTYDLSETLNVYLKGGYFKENLIYNNYTFEGWNFVVGIEISK